MSRGFEGFKPLPPYTCCCQAYFDEPDSKTLKAYFVTASSGVVTETTDARVISIRKLSGGTRKCRASSLSATIVPRNPPLVTTLSPVLSSPKVACHFFWRRCCE